MHPPTRVRYWYDEAGRITQVMVELLDEYNDVFVSTYRDIDTQYLQEASSVAQELLSDLIRKHGHQLPLFP